MSLVEVTAVVPDGERSEPIRDPAASAAPASDPGFCRVRGDSDGCGPNQSPRRGGAILRRSAAGAAATARPTAA